MRFTLVDNSLLDPKICKTRFEEKYQTIAAAEFLTPAGQEMCNLFSQEIAPFTIVAEGGTFQKALPGIVFPQDTETGESLALSWVRGVEIALSDPAFKVQFDVGDIAGKPTKVAVITVGGKSYGFPYRDELPFKGTGEKAQNMGSLEVGDYHLTACKTVKTSFGLKPIVVLNDKEYWINSSLNNLLSMTGDIPKNPGETKQLDHMIRVLFKDKTKQGDPFVRVGFI